MPQLDWRTLVASMTDVQKLVHLATRYDMVNEEALRAQLLKNRRNEYEATLNQLAAEAGCGRSAILSEGPVLSELNDLSRDDAMSIANTYNYELGIAILAISSDTPRANRFAYANRLAKWENRRAKHKDDQIATHTNLTARSLAQRDFNQFNDIDGTAQLVGPNPAAEQICQGWLNRGMVTKQVAVNNPSPFHLGCPHVWDFTLKKLNREDCQDLWMGS